MKRPKKRLRRVGGRSAHAPAAVPHGLPGRRRRGAQLERHRHDGASGAAPHPQPPVVWGPFCSRVNTAPGAPLRRRSTSCADYRCADRRMRDEHDSHAVPFLDGLLPIRCAQRFRYDPAGKKLPSAVTTCDHGGGLFPYLCFLPAEKGKTSAWGEKGYFAFFSVAFMLPVR